MSNHNPYREGKTVIIEAPQRCGKTLTMSILALDEYLTYKSEILSNIAYEDPISMKVKIPYKPLNFFELTMEKIGSFRNRAITIDELNFYLDNRGSMTKINRQFCQWLLQSKKMGINTYGTTHNIEYLDLRFRQNFDFLIQPQMLYNANAETPEQQEIPIGIRMKWTNGPNQRNFKRTVTIDFRQKPQLLGMYNNRHVFNPFAEMEAEMDRQKKNKNRKNYLPPIPAVNSILDQMPDFLKANEPKMIEKVKVNG